MKPIGDSTRSTFKREKNYSGVRMQQGRVQLDADWNEQVDINSHRIETETRDFIGRCGAPLNKEGFKIDVLSDDKDLIISSGRIYVDGILCELEATHLQIISFPENNRAKVSSLILDGRMFEVGQWIEIFAEGKTSQQLQINQIESEESILILNADINESLYNASLTKLRRITTYRTQPDYPILPDLDHSKLVQKRTYLAYLDVWQRHITAIEDPDIREVALGGPGTGPDTATRAKTVWQVKLLPLLPVGNETVNCLSDFPDWEKLIAGSGGKLNAFIEQEIPSTDPCEVSPRAGYRRLENQLYRVEIHDGSEPYSWPRPFKITKTNATVAIVVAGTKDRLTVEEWTIGGIPFKVGQSVEIFSDDTDKERRAGKLAYITDVNETDKMLVLSPDISDMVGHKNLRVRRVATFKWSRDNGSVIFAIEELVAHEPNKIKVSYLGRDKTLGLRAGDWVEVLDDTIELLGMPGTMAEITGPPDETEYILTLSKPISGYDIAGHPKVRRWDQKSDAIPITSNHIELEDGVFVQFSGNNFKTGDYWLIPARTATGDVEWPHDSEKKSIPQSPQGIEHHYCCLALLKFDNDKWELLNDCRRLFPPVTELTSLFYISGDGQEAMPDLTKPKDLVLKVGVANGRWPVAGAKVRFRIVQGHSGQLQSTGKTDEYGIASCNWKLAPKMRSQQVEATLLDAADKPIHLPIIFTANLSIASEVAYDPSACDNQKMKNIKNVQDAIDELCLMGRDREPAIHITKVRLLDKVTSLKNYDSVAVDALAKGIRVEYDNVKNLSENSIIDKINTATCFVTLDIPFPYCYPSNSSDMMRKKKRNKIKEEDKVKVIGFKPLILEANLNVGDTSTDWTPYAEYIQTWLLHQFNTNWSDTRRNWPDKIPRQKCILAHLTLKGNFTWSDSVIAIRDGRSGGDFEMWFWLEGSEHEELHEEPKIEMRILKPEVREDWWERMKQRAGEPINI